MKTYNKKDLMENTKRDKIWNKVVVWHDLTLATVMWHNKPWKVIKEGTTFNTVSDRSYKPIAEFHTQAELLKYIINLK